MVCLQCCISHTSITGEPSIVLRANTVEEILCSLVEHTSASICTTCLTSTAHIQVCMRLNSSLKEGVKLGESS